MGLHWLRIFLPQMERKVSELRVEYMAQFLEFQLELCWKSLGDRTIFLDRTTVRKTYCGWLRNPNHQLIDGLSHYL